MSSVRLFWYTSALMLLAAGVDAPAWVMMPLTVIVVVFAVAAGRA